MLSKSRWDKVVNVPCVGDCLHVAIPHRRKEKERYTYWDYPPYRYVRDILLKNVDTLLDRKADKRIFVGRGQVQWRKVLNEAVLKQFLADYGFAFCQMDDLTMKEQMTLFYNADIVVAPHGSALSNLLFCRKGSTVIEILPYRYAEASNYTYAVYSELRYGYIKGKAINCPGVKPCFEDIEVDIERLEKLFSKMGIVGNE